MQKSTKLKLGIGAGVGILIVGIVFLTLFLTVWAQPNKQDFKVANDATTKAKESVAAVQKPFTAYVDQLTASYKKGSKPEEAMAANKDARVAVFNAISAHTADVEKIGTLKVLNDSEVRKSYDAYKQHETTYAQYLKDYIEAQELFQRSTYYSCVDVLTSAKAARESLGSDLAAFDKAYAETNRKFSVDCLADFTKLSQSPNKPYAEYAKVYLKYYNDRQQVLDDVVNVKLPRSVATLKLSANSVKPIEVATTTFIAARTTDAQKVSSQEIPKAFYDLLVKKEAAAKQ